MLCSLAQYIHLVHFVSKIFNVQWHPYSYIDLERYSDVQNLLDSFHIDVSTIPVMICQGKFVLKNPSNQEIASCLGFNEFIGQTKIRDLVIIFGAGTSVDRCNIWRIRGPRHSGAGNWLAIRSGRLFL